MGAVLLGQSKPEEKKPEESEFTHKAAYMVLIDNDGNFVVEPDINKIVVPERKITGPELKSSLRDLLENVTMQETSMFTMQMMQAKAEQSMLAMQNAQMAKDLKLK